jgi:hypothetical protein
LGIAEAFERECDWVLGDCVYQPIKQGVAGMQLLGGEKHLQCAGLTNDPRKALGASPAGDETEGSAAMSKDSVWARDSVTACERQVESTAHAVALNGGDRRSREVGNGIHQALSHVRELERFSAVEFDDLVEIGPRGEELRATCDDELGVTLVSKIFDRIGQCGYAGAGEAVGLVGREETQNGDVAVRLNFVQILLIFDGQAQ